ncbi:MAG: alanine racemase [Chloroflexota bacterium]|nr:MAG: alanine racemase [Chloroflexota bacterium]
MYSTWAIIDTDAIKNNVRFIKNHTDTEVMAIVKANAYGHGTIPVARAALEGGATWCGVARFSEALELRQAKIDCPMLLLGYTPKEHLEKMIRNQVSLTVWEPDQLELLAEAAKRAGQAARIHLNVDTGMSRIGVQPNEVLGVARKAGDTPGIVFEGLYSHFARADEGDPASADLQWERFQGVLDDLEQEGLLPPVIHQANSAASLTRKETALSLIRFGIAMYGLHPSPECPLPAAFKPALSWKSVLSQVKVLPPGRGVSYGHEYVTRGNERIGTIPVGYADGFRRLGGNQVLVGGKRAPIVGRVTMDQVMVQLDGVPDAKAGDEVVLIGRQGEGLITVEDVAEVWGTINYEVTCGIGSRVPRLYPQLLRE